MQNSPIGAAKILKFKKEKDDNPSIQSHLMKRTYRYFIRHGISNDLRIQTKKRIDTTIFRFEGSLDELSSKRKLRFKRLLSIIHSLKRLSKLKLAISRYNDAITVRELLMFKKVLKKYCSLRSFYFEFDKFGEHLISYNLETFCKNLKKLSSLQELFLTFNPNTVTRQGLNALALGIKKAEFLQNIDWNYLSSRYLEIQILDEIETPSNTRILFEDNFRKTFDKENKRFEFLWYLEGPGASQKKGLKLKSDLDLTTQGLRELNQALEETQSFEYLKMKFFQCQDFSEKDFNKLTENLQRLTCLKRVDLLLSEQSGFPGPIFRTSWLQDKNKSIPWIFLSQGLRKLKYLSLCFMDQVISDKTFQSFSSELKKLWLLESIDIKLNKSYFEKIGKISQGFLALKKSLMQLPLLQKLSLSFSEYNLDKTEIQSLFQDLEGLPCLKEINLEFFNCHIIGNCEVELLGQCIRKISSLQTVRFSFFGYKGVTPQGIRNLYKIFARLKCEIVYDS